MIMKFLNVKWWSDLTFSGILPRVSAEFMFMVEIYVCAKLVFTFILWKPTLWVNGRRSRKGCIDSKSKQVHSVGILLCLLSDDT